MSVTIVVLKWGRLCGLTLCHPQIMEVSFLACNLLNHTLDKVPIGFQAQNFTQNCTQPCFPHS